MTPRTRVGRFASPIALASAVAVAAVVAGLSQPLSLDGLRRPEHQLLLWSWTGGFASLALAALCFAVYAQRALERGAPGRLRLLTLGYASACFGASAALGLCLLHAIGSKLPAGAPLALQDSIWLLPAAYRGALIGLLSLLGAAGLVCAGVSIAAWFLLPLRLRRALFAVADVLLVAAFVALSLRYPFAPTRLTPEALTGASLRLGASLLLGARVSIRLLPLLLSGIELIDFRSLVAARHLRAKKSGFLAAISFLSILAVSVSSCALTTTLSVMGGFRQDLKRKILGNNAHIVVDRADGKLSDYEALSQRVRAVPGVRGVSPYLSGEVMISSASNLAGAVLRGIDLAHIGEVSELPRNLRSGSLSYLAAPERLKELPPGPFGFGLNLPKAARLDSEQEAKAGKAARLSDEIGEALRTGERARAEESGAGARGGGRERRVGDAGAKGDAGAGGVERLAAGGRQSGERARAGDKDAPALPGIVVGQELARSLRLYLGDEVNVVTPLGELGPTGPLPKSRPFRIAGIFYSGMYEYDMKFAYVTLAAAQRFLNAASTASGIEITVREPERAQEVAAQIARAANAPGLRVRAWQELNKNLFGALALEKLAMFVALGIAILVASFCIIGTLTLMVQEKGREVAVLKAMGAGDRAIIAIFVLEGTLIGVLGSLLGLGLGYAVCFAAEYFGVHLNPEVYYIDKLPVHIDPSEFLAVGIAAIAVSLLVTIYPAQLASRLRPVDALRYE